MSLLKEWGLTVGVVLALVLAIYGINNPAVTQIVREVKETVGSASSPSVINGCMEVNGMTKCYYGERMKAATTTVCSLRITATSTIVHASSEYETASTSATRVFIAKGANSNATTTAFATGLIPAAGGGVLVASTTGNFAGGINPSSILFPGDYLNFQAPDIKSLGDVGTGAAARGLCVVETVQY